MNLSKYKRKSARLIRNPSKIRYLPNFIRLEIKRSVKKYRSPVELDIGGFKSKFYVKTDEEADRFENLMDEGKIIEQVLEKCNEDSIFWDIGANIGIYSCLVGKKLSSGEVIAFEPLDTNFERLKENSKLNDLKVSAHKVALQDKNEQISLEAPNNNPGQGKAKINGSKKSNTLGMKGDSLLEDRNIPKPDIIKIDVEGAELKVLRGLEKTLSESNELNIFLEIHPDSLRDFGDNESDLMKYMEDLGYEKRIINERGDQKHVLLQKSN